MQLTQNFNLEEFRCKDGSEFPADVVDNIRELANNLQIIRDKINKPMKINSGYRSKTYNAKVGGKPQSQHLTGKAADIAVEGMTPKELAFEIKKLMDQGLIKKGGLKAYSTFTHYDIRGKYVTW